MGRNIRIKTSLVEVVAELKDKKTLKQFGKHYPSKGMSIFVERKYISQSLSASHLSAKDAQLLPSQ